MAKNDEALKVWSTVGATLPIPNTYAHIKFSFGHERLYRELAELEATEQKMHAYNLSVLNARLAEFQKDVEAIVKPKKKKGKKK